MMINRSMVQPPLKINSPKIKYSLSSASSWKILILLYFMIMIICFLLIVTDRPIEVQCQRQSNPGTVNPEPQGKEQQRELGWEFHSNSRPDENSLLSQISKLGQRPEPFIYIDNLLVLLLFFSFLSNFEFSLNNNPDQVLLPHASCRHIIRSSTLHPLFCLLADDLRIVYLLSDQLISSPTDRLKN